MINHDQWHLIGIDNKSIGPSWLDYSDFRFICKKKNKLSKKILFLGFLISGPNCTSRRLG